MYAVFKGAKLIKVQSIVLFIYDIFILKGVSAVKVLIKAF